MSTADTTATAGRIAVVDLGSNSLRLVVFERLGGVSAAESPRPVV